jgi:hypothetical protein
MDVRDLERAPDDDTSPAFWARSSELESEQSMMDEDFSLGHSLDSSLPRSQSHSNVIVQDDASSSASWIESVHSSWRDSGTSSEQAEDDSFDHVLDGLSSNNNVSLSKLCEHCRILIDILPEISWRNRSDGGFIHINIPHVQGPLALQNSAAIGCGMCSIFLSWNQMNSSYALISQYVARWRAKHGEAPFPNGKIMMNYYDWRGADNGPRSINLTFPLVGGPYDDGALEFIADLRISAKPRELTRIYLS